MTALDTNPKRKTEFTSLVVPSVPRPSQATLFFGSVLFLLLAEDLTESDAHVPSISDSTWTLHASYYLTQVAVDCFHF
jgi:hypothetical protein